MRKRQTSPRIKRPPSQGAFAHRDGGQLFLRHITFFRGSRGKQLFSPCFISFAQLRLGLTYFYCPFINASASICASYCTLSRPKHPAVYGITVVKRKMVDLKGFTPSGHKLQIPWSTAKIKPPFGWFIFGGPEGIRTLDLSDANESKALICIDF